jgi:hypothetical protein
MVEAAVIALVLVAIFVVQEFGSEMPRRRGSPPGLTATPLPFRFSLRTLLIGVTVVAALLGAVIWAVR